MRTRAALVTRMTALVALVGALIAPAVVVAKLAPGDLDPSFGNHGRVTTRCLIHCHAHAVTIDSHRRIVAVGESTNASLGVLRYRPSGKLDHSFGGEGRVSTHFPLPLPDVSGTSVALDSHGRIVAAGSNCDFDPDDPQCRFALARYLPNGKLDHSFSGDGRVTTTFGHYDWLTSVAIDPEGRIVAAGHHCDAGGCSFIVARYRPNGHLDLSFGGDGSVITRFGSYSELESVTVDGEGRIVAAGWGSQGGRGSWFALARYLPNGQLDASFGTSGKVTTRRGGAESAVIDPRGRILVAGSSSRAFALVRYRPNGHLDPSFGEDGRVTTRFPTGAEAIAVGIDSRNRIVATGDAGSDAALARYRPNGRLDRSFGTHGRVTTGFGSGGGAGPYAAAIDRRNRIVAAGGHTNFVLARFVGGD